ncbi:MAG: hypothetical protein BGO31_14360 [Bacteroidetes bacterium 43-16]|nr:MAG: hypothetical protein BGO31_14360 [Bacteroidetes bacterium 43-16]
MNFEEVPGAIEQIFEKISEINNKIEKSSVNELPEVMSIEQVAEMLHCSKQTIYNRISQKTIPHTKNGENGATLFLRSDVLSWLRSFSIKTKQDQFTERESKLKSVRKK